MPATLFHRLDEPRVRKIVDRWIDYLAIGIFNIVAVADPECVLLGGGICREQQLLPLVNAALDKIPQWSDFHTVVKRCRHTNNAGLIGAYYASKPRSKAWRRCRSASRGCFRYENRRVRFP